MRAPVSYDQNGTDASPGSSFASTVRARSTGAPETAASAVRQARARVTRVLMLRVCILWINQALGIAPGSQPAALDAESDNGPTG